MSSRSPDTTPNTPTVNTPSRPSTSSCDGCGACDDFCPSGGGGGGSGSSDDLLWFIGIVLPIVVLVSFILALSFWRTVNTRCEVLDIGCYEKSVVETTDDIGAKSRVNSSSECNLKKGEGSLKLDVEYENADGKEVEGGMVIRGTVAKNLKIMTGKNVDCNYSKSDEKLVYHGHRSAESVVVFFISLFFLIVYVAFVQLTSESGLLALFRCVTCQDSSNSSNGGQHSVDPGASNADTVPPNEVPSSNPPDAQMMDATRQSDTGLLSGRPDGLASLGGSLGAPRPQTSAPAAPTALASTPPALAQSKTASKSGFEGVSMDAVNIRGLGNVSERSAGSSSGGAVDEGEASAPSAAASQPATDSAATTTADSGGGSGDGTGGCKASAVEKGKADALAQASNMFKGGFGKR